MNNKTIKNNKNLKIKIKKKKHTKIPPHPVRRAIIKNTTSNMCW
jgi:hypothetical protein